MKSEEIRNLVLAIVLSAIVLIGWNYFFAPKLQPPTHANAPVAAGTATPAANSASAPQSAAPGGEAVKPRAETLAASPRVTLDAPGIGGSINLEGGEIDDVFLKGYRETIDPNSPHVVLFSPSGSAEPYWAETGFVTPDKGVKTPTRQTRWTASGRRSHSRKSGDADLRQRRGPRLHARDRGRRQVHVHGDRQGREQERQAGVARPYALILRRGTPPVMRLFRAARGLRRRHRQQLRSGSHLRQDRQGDRRGPADEGRRRLARLHRQILGLRHHPRPEPAGRRALLGERPAGAAGLSVRLRRAGRSTSPPAPRPRSRRASSPAPRRCRSSTNTRPSSASRNSN